MACQILLIAFPAAPLLCTLAAACVCLVSANIALDVARADR